MIALLIFWCISPIVLIPLLICSSVENSKKSKKILYYQNALNGLLASGAITREQYDRAMNSVVYPNINQGNVQPYQPPINFNYPQPNIPPQQPIDYGPPPVNANREINQPSFVQTYPLFAPLPSVAPIMNKETKRVSTINIVLIVGVIFIILSGLIFATTTWQFLSNAIRTAIILSFTVIFFGVSTLAHKKLKLQKTGTAFYILGSIFLPITVLSIGYFSLLGTWLSMRGGGKFILLLFACISLGISTCIGAMKYKLKPFAWTMLFSITASVICIVQQFKPTNDAFGLCIAIYATLFIFTAQLFSNKHNDKFSIFLSSLDNFTIINTLILSVITAISTQNSIMSSVSTITFAFIFLKGIFNKNSASLGAYPFAIFMLLALYKLILPDSASGYLLIITTVAVTSTLLGSMKLFGDNLKKVLQIISAGLAVIVFAIAGLSFTFEKNWTLTALITVFVLLLNTTWIGIKNKSKLIISLQSVILILFFNGIACYTASTDYMISLVVAALTLLAFFIYRITKIFYTRFGDVAFTAAAFICGVVSILDNQQSIQAVISLICMIIFVLITAVIAFEKDDSIISEIYSWLLPFSLFGITGATLIFTKLQNKPAGMFSNNFFIYFLVLSIIAIASTFYKKKHYIAFRTARPFEVTSMISGGVFFIYSVVNNERTLPYLWVLSALCGIMGYLSYKSENSKQGTVYRYFSFALALFASFVSTSNYTEDSIILALVPTIFSIIFFVGYIIISKVFKSDAPVSRQVLIFSAFSTSIMSGIMTIVLCCNHNSAWFVLICLTAGILSYTAFYLLKSNIFAVIPMLILYPIINELCRELIYNPSRELRLFSSFEALKTIISIIAFFIIALTARVIHKRILVKTENDIMIDWLTIFNIFALANIQSNKYQPFIYCIIGGIYILLYYNRIGGNKTNCSILTIACSVWCFSLWLQPFVKIPDIINTELNVVPIILFCVAITKIWKERKDITSIICFILSALSIAYVSIDAIISQELANALILGLAMLAMLLISFTIKRKKWFILSTSVLVFLSIYLSRHFWLSLAWWVYLLAVGIILITIASINEIKKQKGESLKINAGRFMSDWEW